jgi:hypothetical protein
MPFGFLFPGLLILGGVQDQNDQEVEDQDFS